MAATAVNQSIERQWHLNKGVNLSHLLTTLALAGALAGVWMDQRESIVRLEERQEAIKEAEITSREALLEDVHEMKTDIKTIQALLLRNSRVRGQ